MQSKLVLDMYLLHVDSHACILFGRGQDLYYDIDEDGVIIANDKGK